MGLKKGRHPQVDEAVFHFISEIVGGKALTLSMSGKLYQNIKF